MSNSFVVGDKVLLSNKIGFCPTPHWPVMGSHFHCEGTVTYVGTGCIGVYWDNGMNHHYLPNSLVHLNTVEEIPV